MKFFIIFTIIWGIAIPGFSQESSGNQSVSQARLRAEVDTALSFVDHGRELYERSEMFQRMVDRRVEVHLALDNNKKANSDKTLAGSAGISSEADISNTSEDENEPSIAICRTNPKLIVCGANDYDMFNTGAMSAYVSTDAGSTWKTWHLPKVDYNGAIAAGDPVVISDDLGNFYYSFMVDPLNQSGYNNPYYSDVMVARSSNGTTWTLGGPVVRDTAPGYAYEDKENIAIDRDPHSPYYGRLYVVWTHYINQTGWLSVPMLAYSSDNGNTWSQPRAYTTDFGYFATIRVGNNGTVFISSSHLDQQGSYYEHAMTVSTDGGETFTDQEITSYQNYPSSSWLNSLKGDPGIRAFPYVTFDVDPSNNTLYTVYGTFDSYGFAADYAIVSTDTGNSWSDPYQIGSNDFLERDHFFPWVSFDPLLKQASITLYSSEEDTNNIQSRAVRTTFDAPDTMQNLGSDLFDPKHVLDAFTRNFIGDYIGCDAYNGYFAAAWTENHPNAADGDIFAYVSTPTSPNKSGISRSINTPVFSVSPAVPNPASGASVSFAVTTNDESAISVRMFDLRGVEVLLNSTQIYNGGAISLDIHALSAGVYRAVISNGRQQVENSFIVLR